MTSKLGYAMSLYSGLSVDACDRLIVVDMQNQFISPETEKLVPTIEALIPLFKKAVISQIEHDPDQCVYALKKWTPAPFGSEGHKCALDLSAAEQTQIHFTRKRFFSAVTEDALEFLDLERGDSVYLCGMDTDICVLQTGVELLKIGMRPVVLGKHCASYGGEALHKHALIQCKRFFGTDQVLVG